EARAETLAGAVLAMDAPAREELDRIGRFGAHRDELRDVGRVVLAVAVERRDPCAARRLHAVADRRALPALRNVVHDAKLGIRRLRLREHGERVVLARVVDVDDLEIGAAAQRSGDLGEQRRDVVALVEDRHDDRKLRHDTGSTMRGADYRRSRREIARSWAGPWPTALRSTRIPRPADARPKGPP